LVRYSQGLLHRARTAGGSQAGFDPSQPGASGLLSLGSRFFASLKGRLSHELQLSNREAEAHHVSCACSKLYFLDSAPSWEWLQNQNSSSAHPLPPATG